MKRCFKCGDEKPISDFYRHPQMSDGHLGKCKDCTKLDMRVDRHTKPRVREYDRQRSTLPHRVALRTSIVERWAKKYPDRVKAQHAAQNALRDGKLKRPYLCDGCGLPKRLEKHHPDYSRQLLVVCLCKVCHAIADKVRRKVDGHMKESA